jgi:hypothetical protein
MPRPRLTKITPESVEHYPPGNAAISPQPGDFIVTHGKGFFDQMVRFGETLRVSATDRQYAYWNHAALIQAMAQGVERGSLSDYATNDYYLVRIKASDEDRSEVVAFGEWALDAHSKYGFLTLVSVALTIITGWKLTFFIDGSFICSGLVARAQERTTALFSHDPVRITPAELAQYYGVPSPAASAS